MKKKYMTTYWMDLLTYIVIPFITLVASVRVIRALLYNPFSWALLFSLIVEVLFITLYVLTVLNSHRRAKAAYWLFRILIIATAIRAAVDFSITEVSDYNPILSFVGYLAICVIVWVYPNEVYFKNRKELFKSENSITIFKNKKKDKKENKIKDEVKKEDKGKKEDK